MLVIVSILFIYRHTAYRITGCRHIVHLQTHSLQHIVHLQTQSVAIGVTAHTAYRITVAGGCRFVLLVNSDFKRACSEILTAYRATDLQVTADGDAGWLL